MKKILSLLTIFIFILVGCSQSSSDTIEISGSTSAGEYMNILAEEYYTQTGVNVEYQAIGSSAGIKNAEDGVTPFGVSSRSLKPEEESTSITQEIIAYNGIVMVTSKNNDNAANLTVEQIQQIYKGEITNWSEVGGSDAEIVVVSRESGSGTRSSFEDATGLEESDITQDALISEGSGNVASTVASNDNAIGYIALDTYEKNKEQLNALMVDGVEATAETIKDGTYPIMITFYILYHQENLNETDQKFIDWLMTEGIENVAPKTGLVTP